MAFGLGSRKQEPIRERGVHGTLARSPTGVIKESYEQIRKLGEGGQGKLWVVKRKSDRRVLVRKEQKDYSMRGDVPTEMYIFETVLARHHPNIVDFDHANYLQRDGRLVLYFEHCRGGDLHRHCGTGVSESFIWACFAQLAGALAFLHYGHHDGSHSAPSRNWQRVVHRDLKPANVFLRRAPATSRRHPEQPEFVLGDFGLATLEAETEGCGTHEWIGPEIPLLTKQNDVWALGAIVHALVHGAGPVAEVPPKGWTRGLRAWRMDPGARRPRQLGRGYSTALNRCMMSCLNMDPGRRVTSRQLVDILAAEWETTLR